MTYINLIHWLAGFLVVAYTAFGLFVLHDENEFSHARERCSQRCERLKNLVVH